LISDKKIENKNDYQRGQISDQPYIGYPNQSPEQAAAHSEKAHSGANQRGKYGCPDT